MKPVATESQEQQAVVEWWDSYCKTQRLDYRLLVAIPNGSVLAGDARRKAMQAARLKREGMRPGHPDLQLAVMRGGYGGLKIEMKRKGWKPLKSDLHFGLQLEYMMLLKTQGYLCATAAGAKEAIEAIEYYLKLGKP